MEGVSKRELPSDVKDTVSKLGPDERSLLLEHTARVLDRHAEIEQNQRKIALRIFQVWVAGAGVTIAAIPYVGSFIEGISLAGDLSVFEAVIGSILLFVGIFLVLPVPGVRSEIPALVAEVLTPEPYGFGPLRKFMFLLPLGRERDDTGRGDIRSVSMTDELMKDLLTDTPAYDEKLIHDRLSRIRDNEDSLNRNSEQLTNVFHRINLAIEFVLLGVFFLIYGLVLLTV